MTGYCPHGQSVNGNCMRNTVHQNALSMVYFACDTTLMTVSITSACSFSVNSG